MMMGLEAGEVGIAIWGRWFSVYCIVDSICWWMDINEWDDLTFLISSSDHWIVSWMELRNFWNSWTSSKEQIYSSNVPSAFHAQSYMRLHLGWFLKKASILFSSTTSAAVLVRYWVVLPLGAFCLGIHSQGKNASAKQKMGSFMSSSAVRSVLGQAFFLLFVCVSVIGSWDWEF